MMRVLFDTMKIKTVPQDFIVNEVSNVEVKDKGRFLYFLLKKENWNTLDVVRKLSSALHVPQKSIGFAGSKDKKAVTTQLISFVNVSRERVEDIILNDISLEFVGYGDKPISLGDLSGNAFEIVVRDVSGCSEISFIPNYFDTQRFGEYNVRIGKALVKKDFHEAVRVAIRTGQCEELREHTAKFPQDYVGALQQVPIRHLRMYVNAYQSWLWNETVSRYINDIEKEVKYKEGMFIFPKHFIDLDVPYIGWAGEVDGEFESIINEIMKEEEITFEDFLIRQIPKISLEGGLRKACVPVGDFQCEEVDDGVKLSFFLPKGSYATMVVKGLFG
ncbi:MAG: hypothetical protein CMH61_01820 [Nanoarchaeota archaeon]|nr:hypothetical protein [Nanoarchaeota archaeon]